MNNQQKGNGMLPIVIIGLVFVGALAGAWFWYSSTATSRGNGNRTPTPNKTSDTNYAEIYAKASPGANPPQMLGSPTATVTVEEFADFQCPTCAAKHPIAKEIISTYGSRIKFIYRNFPLQIPAHDKAYDASVAAEAAGLQGKFWDMQHQLFSNQPSWTTKDPAAFRGVLEEFAQKIGLDVEKFKNDMAGLQAKSRVDLDLQRGRSLRVSSTPSFFVNGKPILLEQMTVEGFKQAIDAELQKPPQ